MKALSKKEQLLSAFAASSKVGGGVLTLAEIAFYLNTQNNIALRKLLTDCVKKGMVRRLAAGIYESTLTPPDPMTAIYKVAKKVRGGVLNYISLESQLSHTGVISQIVMGRVTMMTKGRTGTFETPYGIIEFTHTSRSVDKIVSNIYLDPEIMMYRASNEQAISDLRATKRNLHMLEN
ncbi:hypothetical protein AB4343_03555 [Vibrio breoganii]|uniref:type IV toxin-antitoxin system AbiEi family antitoxin n=1 Tax=Vibrio breoganii TaxID=553239 RepID=UPI000C825A20|nr:hypothetical protein [Vibrio breoganii]PMK74221.1 hypothetical protein BCT94_10530 [Vibrio breoganii]PMP07283.1 hypothetical protein BCS94_09975 [Vibrio breoganii]